MNIAERFARSYLQDELGIGTFGQDIFIGSVPQSAPEAAWWLYTSGGGKTADTPVGGSMKQYQLDVLYRSVSAEDVYNKLQELEESINADGCTQLAGYDTIDIEATLFPADQDLDSENRTVGLLQVRITTYKE